MEIESTLNVGCSHTAAQPLRRHMVGSDGFEPSWNRTSLSTAYQAEGIRPEKWSYRWDLNPRHPPYQDGALPTELRQHEDGATYGIRTRDFLRDRQVS